jgi:hypothetical protein
MINQLKQELNDDKISSLFRTLVFQLQLGHLEFKNFLLMKNSKFKMIKEELGLNLNLKLICDF